MNEIYGGEDSIVRHWLKAPWNMDGWRLDVVHMLGEAGGARGITFSTSPDYALGESGQPEAFVFGEHFGDARQWLQNDAEDAAMNYRGFTFPLWGFLANTDISYDPNHIDAETCMAWMENYRAVCPISSSCGCSTSSIVTIPPALNPCSARMWRVCRWR